MAPALDGPGRAICFRLGAANWGLPLEAVAEVWAEVPTRSLRGAPPAIAGLAALAGRIVAVVDLAQILAVEISPSATCLLRLSAPLDGYALRVPADVELASVKRRVGAPPGDSSELEDGTRVVLLDLDGLSKRIGALGGGAD